MSGGLQAVNKHRFFVDADVFGDKVTITDANMLRQWKTVLRLKLGSDVVLVAQGVEASGVIESWDKSGATIAIMNRATVAREPGRSVTLYCSLLKRENFEWVVQKAVEVGVTRIVPVKAERTVKLGFRRERLESIIREAAEQSGRLTLPQLTEPMTVAEAIADSAPIKHRYFFVVEGGEKIGVQDQESAAAFIGPEGGWSEAEQLSAVAADIKKASLGPLVLRAETAAIIATYCLGL